MVHEVDLSLHGSPSPEGVAGRIHISQGFLRDESLPHPLREVKGLLRIAGRRIEIEDLEGR